jgi:hypothetical protein
LRIERCSIATQETERGIGDTIAKFASGG